MRESDLLSHIERRSRAGPPTPGVLIGPGDDCAVLDLTGATLATVDHLVAGRHFDAERTDLDRIARKAVARSVSDIAAMGGVPVCGLATGCLPDGYPDGDALFDRMAHWAMHWGCPLAGGDIAFFPGPMVLTVTVLGRPHRERGPVLRSGAAEGDAVYVTGRLGGAVASGRHEAFEPRLVEAAWLCDALGRSLHAMIDLSDGLGRDAGRIARASGVRIEIEAPLLPLHGDAGGWRAAAAEGEDYELLFTASPDAPVPDRCPTTGTPVSRIGRVRAGSGCLILDGAGGAHPGDELGWDHGA